MSTLRLHTYLQIILSCFVLTSCTLFAQDTTSSANQYNTKRPQAQASAGNTAQNGHLYIGGNYTRARLSPKGYSVLSGNLGGLQAGFEYFFLSGLYEGIEFTWRQGSVKHDQASRDLLDFDTQGRIGYTLRSTAQYCKTTFFTGFGWRYLGEYLKFPGVLSMHFNYNQPYLPVGLCVNWDLCSWFSLGGDFTWMPQLFPTVNLIPLGGARWIVKRTYANCAIKLPCQFTLQKGKSITNVLTITPFFQFWQDGRSIARTRTETIGSDPSVLACSITGTALGLPQNTYYFYGVELNLGVLF